MPALDLVEEERLADAAQPQDGGVPALAAPQVLEDALEVRELDDPVNEQRLDGEGVQA